MISNLPVDNKEQLRAVAISTLDSLIETVVQLSRPAVAQDEMVNVHLVSSAKHL